MALLPLRSCAWLGHRLRRSFAAAHGPGRIARLGDLAAGTSSGRILTVANGGTTLLIGLVLLVLGMALVLWGAERFTEGAVGTALRFQLSTFYVGALVSGFEPENLVTGIAAALGHLHQIVVTNLRGAAHI